MASDLLNELTGSSINIYGSRERIRGELIENAKKYLHLEGIGENIYKTDLNGKIALIVGGEDTGVNKLTKKKADYIVSIPMLGKINSLNASVAAGVALFEALRQRTQK